jgi:hypothetical protein
VANFPFKQVDVFTDKPFFGNPAAVVIDAEGLDQSFRDDFPAASAGRGRRLSAEDLHPGAGTAVCGTTDHRERSRGDRVRICRKKAQRSRRRTVLPKIRCAAAAT